MHTAAHIVLSGSSNLCNMVFFNPTALLTPYDSALSQAQDAQSRYSLPAQLGLDDFKPVAQWSSSYARLTLTHRRGVQFTLKAQINSLANVSRHTSTTKQKALFLTARQSLHCVVLLYERIYLPALLLANLDQLKLFVESD